MFNSLFVRAIKWKNGTVVRMRTNPMASIERRVGCKRRFRPRLEEGIEDRLFAACDRLDDVPPSAWTKLDWNKAEEIRQPRGSGGVAAGDRGRLQDLTVAVLRSDRRRDLEPGDPRAPPAA